jgi:hypothetical protein
VGTASTSRLTRLFETTSNREPHHRQARQPAIVRDAVERINLVYRERAHTIRPTNGHRLYRSDRYRSSTSMLVPLPGRDSHSHVSLSRIRPSGRTSISVEQWPLAVEPSACSCTYRKSSESPLRTPTRNPRRIGPPSYVAVTTRRLRRSERSCPR